MTVGIGLVTTALTTINKTYDPAKRHMDSRDGQKTLETIKDELTTFVFNLGMTEDLSLKEENELIFSIKRKLTDTLTMIPPFLVTEEDKKSAHKEFEQSSIRFKITKCRRIVETKTH